MTATHFPLIAKLFFLLSLGCCSAAAPAVPGFAQTASVATPSDGTRMGGADLYRARNVLRRFFANERRPECYWVLFSNVDGNLLVEFVPRQPRVVVIREGEPRDPNAQPRCGRNEGYVIDRRGNVIRRIFSR